jgi:hypothetical protein
LWRQAITLPPGTRATLASDAQKNCADLPGLSRAGNLFASGGGFFAQVGSLLLAGAKPGGWLLLIGLISVSIGCSVIRDQNSCGACHPPQQSRRDADLRQRSRTREQAIIDAFDLRLHYRYEGVSQGGPGCLFGLARPSSRRCCPPTPANELRLLRK